MGELDNYSISSDRLIDPNQSHDGLECIIYHNILSKPVSCKTCLNSFCSNCINTWLITQSVCPYKCNPFEKRQPPPITMTFLSKLNISCRNKSRGCEEALLYDSLENHEQKCEYQSVQCQDCKQEIVQKDFAEHREQCTDVFTECPKCSTKYKRRNANKHTEIKCLQISMQRKMDEALKRQQQTFNKALKQQQETFSQQLKEAKTKNADAMRQLLARVTKLEGR
ncbi:unnamed protein product [Didymodactylos carnosus]|uniref:Uncharacterized protein n=1 Tax=Didymodactylos carnosus TaxID=1234261 RepID=A0A814WDJ7_9BILA|nr:unnamed protein product [Didymodactylos carnosus]CAF3968163.1 unnamed protein product [Didymodactylos carnosus]